MYHEKLKRAPLPPLIGLCGILALVLIIIGVSSLSATLFSRFGIPYFDFFIVGVLAVAGFLLMKRFMYEYGYSLDGDTLVFYRILGNRELPVLATTLGDVLSYDTALPGGDERLLKTYYFLYKRKEHKTRITITKNGNTVNIYFQPSAELDAMIKERLGEIQATIN